MNAFKSILDCLATHDSISASPGLDVEQHEIVSFLCKSRQQSMLPLHVEVRRAHIFWFAHTAYLLHRPLRSGDYDCLTVEARWRWCEAQLRDHPSARPIPIARRNRGLHLGGPGQICDWLLKFKIDDVEVSTTQYVRETA